MAAGVAVDPSCFGGAKSSLEDREVGFNELNGVEGFLGVPKLVVRGSGCAVWGCGGGNVGCGSADVGVGFGMASLEERAGVAMRDFLLLGTALGRGVASSDVWVGCAGSSSSTSISVDSGAGSSRGSSADVRGTKGSNALADTLEVRAFDFGGLSGESDSNSRI